ncbi:LysR family transcriptional regulator [Rhodovibrio salinarum]|uniref:LysR family transcriptional regulator n=1 Tax=Rhodovibrio salinarum TaxID=1087 RepID=A0A934QKM9_9PROT|nr:LysR family transcriptional regulator [Rhodovibrio salinarum]MBK1698661.1 LysR family transcriptional regulator [Rhodovibrio salinarum]
MDLVDGLRVFVAAAETGSFAGAARRLAISNKLASKYIGELERRLGVQLFQRTTRRLGMTTAGELLIARAPAWLDALDEMTADLREEGAGLTGTLRLAAPVTFGEMYVQPMLLRLQRVHPDLKVDLRLSDRHIDLASEGIDLAIRIGELGNSSLIARRLGRSEVLLVASPRYLEQHGAPETPADLTSHHCIRDSNMLEDSKWPLFENETPQWVKVSGQIRVNSARAARNLAVAGEGIAFCPDYAVAPDLTSGQLVRVLERVRTPIVDINAVYLKSHHIPRRTRATIEFMVQEGFARQFQ